MFFYYFLHSWYLIQLGISYSEVLGMAVGYQKSIPDGFDTVHAATKGSLDGLYVDGVSI